MISFLSAARWKYLLFAVAVAALAECAGSLVLHHTRVAEQCIDIQSPASLSAKLDYLRRFDGYKIVLLGDSLVYGGILEDYGDHQWRSHNLSSLLEELWQQEFPDEPVLVMNLGINGALPADIEQLATLVVQCRVNLILFDTHLRPFSRDFAGGESQFARPWLKDFGDRSESWFPALEHYSSLCRLREFTQQRLVSSESARTIQSFRKSLNGRGSEHVNTQDPDLILLQLQGRLNGVDFASSNPQCQAMTRTLRFLREYKQRTLIFYAKENPSQIYSVMSPKKHKKLYGDLLQYLKPQLNQDVLFAPPCSGLDSCHYLDYAHLNHDGYHVLSKYLWPKIAADSH